MAIWRRRRYVRRCRACGTEWAVSRRAARARPPGRRRRSPRAADVLSAGPRVMSDAYVRMLDAERAQRAAAADRELELLEALRRCPGCGAKDFTQRRGSA